MTPARPSGRRPGDSGTREAILAAAARQFAELGFDRTSMRGIAQEAGVDPALVTHFFKSKQRLFVTVVELPVDPDDVVRVLLEGARSEVGQRLATFFLGVLESEPGRRRVTGLVRAAASAPEAADLLRDTIATRLLAPLADALGVDEPLLRANLCGTQVVGLVMVRYIVRMEPLASEPPERVAAAIAPNLQRLLTGPLTAGERP
jgi:AcrR family transcriptional regulator